MKTAPSSAHRAADTVERLILAAALPALVAVYADGYPKSQEMLSLLEVWTAEARGRVKVVRVNVAETPATVQRCGLSLTPGLALFHRWAVCFQFSGEVSRQELDEVLVQADLVTRKVARCERVIPASVRLANPLSAANS